MKMNITALLTAKGSSSLANKNILPVLNKPLLSYPAEVARKSHYINSFFVSSEDEKILKIAGRLGYKKILRPKYLARANSRHADAIIHAITNIKKKENFTPDILVVLLANSACIKTEWIDRCIKEILDNQDLSAVVPVCMDLDHHPFRAKKLNKNGLLEPFFDFKGKEISTNRQELEPSYFLCHNFWVLNVRISVFSKNGQQPWSFMGKKIKPLIVDDCCDLHSEKDLIKIEAWLKKNKP